MRTIRSLSAITGLLALAAWTSSAHAGHLNVVLQAQLIGPEEVSTGSAMAGDPDGPAPVRSKTRGRLRAARSHASHRRSGPQAPASEHASA